MMGGVSAVGVACDGGGRVCSAVAVRCVMTTDCGCSGVGASLGATARLDGDRRRHHLATDAGCPRRRQPHRGPGDARAGVRVPVRADWNAGEGQ